MSGAALDLRFNGNIENGHQLKTHRIILEDFVEQVSLKTVSA